MLKHQHEVGRYGAGPMGNSLPPGEVAADPAADPRAPQRALDSYAQATEQCLRSLRCWQMLQTFPSDRKLQQRIQLEVRPESHAKALMMPAEAEEMGRNFLKQNETSKNWPKRKNF